jgi:hypothetical protein
MGASFMYNGKKTLEKYMKAESINCIRCKYYYVTWDTRFPRGCSLFDFKSASMPSIIVMQSTGAQCKNFTLKELDKSSSRNV